MILNFKSLYIIFVLLLPLNSYALEIALSFDDAPKPDGAIFTGEARTQQLINILDKKNVKEVAIYANTRDFTWDGIVFYDNLAKRIKA